MRIVTKGFPMVAGAVVEAGMTLSHRKKGRGAMVLTMRVNR
jgi:hypothetical protein